MTNSDKKLILVGAGPAVVCALLMLGALVSGAELNGTIGALAMAGVLSAIAFPAFANVLRMRRDQ